MSLNPITALSEQLQKLINERGSAAILRDHLALFKDQVALLEKKNVELVAENATLAEEIQILQSEKEQLTKDNEVLRSKIQEYEQPTEQSTHDNLLEEVRGRILYWLSKNSMTAEQVSNTLQIGLEVAKYHLVELKKMKMVRDSFQRAKYNQIFTVWTVDQEGRKYLVENNLIT